MNSDKEEDDDDEEEEDEERYQRRIIFTKESSTCSAFPHQVHGPGQGAGAGKCPSVHASVLVAEAATAGSKYQVTRVSREPVMIRDGKGNLERAQVN